MGQASFMGLGSLMGRGSLVGRGALMRLESLMGQASLVGQGSLMGQGSLVGQWGDLWGWAPQGPPGEVIQPLPLQSPPKSKRSIDASQPLADDPASRPTSVGLEELLGAVGREIEALRRPTGSRENPARSCQDLRLSHPHLTDGLRPIAPHSGHIGTHREP